jgi:hypothetical protein
MSTLDPLDPACRHPLVELRETAWVKANRQPDL